MSSSTYILQTERLRFRRYRATDRDLLRPVFADPDAARFYPAMNSDEAIDRWICWNLENYETYGHGLWALELLDSGVFIGDTGITFQTVEDQRVLEIGWHIHPNHRARGYATEAGKASLRYGFDILQAKMLCSIVDPANTASITVASRVHTQHRSYQGKNWPRLLYYSTHRPIGSKNDCAVL